MKKFLYGATVVVTGASSGIGKELVKRLLSKYGCTVVGVGRSEEKFIALQTELGELSARFSYRLFDVGDRAAWETFRNDLSATRPDVFIGCAGILPPFAAYERGAEAVFQTNFFSAVYAFETLSPLMQGNSKARFVFVSSSSALCPFAGIAAYSASKTALLRFAECLAAERGIKTSVILPGFTKTDVFRSQSFDEETEKFFNKFAMSAEKSARKILRAVVRGKKRKIVGFDARLMDIGYRFFPKLTPKLITAFLRKARKNDFKNIVK